MQKQSTRLDLIKNEEEDAIQNVSINTSKQANNNIVYKIILRVLGFVIIILGIIDLIIFLTPKPTNSPASEGEVSDAKNIFDYDFDNLTKEQTIAAFKIMNQPGYMPKGYADPTLALKTEETHIVLDYSYESIDEIEEIDYHVSDFGKNEITTTLVGDYYAIVSTEDYKDIHSPAYWPKAVSFNKKYVDYYKETIGNSTNDRIVFTDTSSAVVQKTLPVYAVTTTMTQPSSIYSYELKESESYYSLTLNCIGISIDMEEYMAMVNAGSYPTTVSDIPYTITNYIVTLNLNKKTGEPNWNKKADGSISELIKSFRLDEQDKNNLTEYLNKPSV